MVRLKLKDSIYILKEDDSTYQVLFTATRRAKKFRVDGLTKEVIALLREPTDEAVISRKLSSNYQSSDISSCILALQNFGIIVDQGEQDIKVRYQRQLSFISELTSSLNEALELQSRLERSKIAVFGIGGIGTWMVNSLYQLGIGELRIIDPDIVNETNLNRQLFFTEQDVGKSKVDVVKQKLSDANIKIWKTLVSPNENLEEIVEGTNFFVNCADYPSVADTTRVLEKYARRFNVAYSVAGGYNMHLGMIGPIIIPGKTACFDCFLDYQKRNDPLSHLEKVKDIEQTGSLGPIAGAVANMQAMEIFKHIIGKGKINYNRFAEIDFMNLSIEWREFDRRADCSCSVKA